MKNVLLTIIFLVAMLFRLQVSAQVTLNTTQIGHLAYQEELSEVRGALHNGREYALVGVHNGFSIVDLNDPSNPTEVFFEPGPNSTWRDPFYHNGHAYCVTEGGGGLLIVNMSPLPGSTNLTTTLYTGSDYEWSSAHNMFIDEANDKAYIFGSSFGGGGAIILDISSPMAPVELGVWDDHYIHDGFVRGDTLWAACLEEGVFLVDVSNPASPIELANWDTPSEFAHNVWPSEDNAYCYTTDEVESGFVAGYDMDDLQNVVETDKVQHPLSENVIPHNTHFLNDYLVTSHYRDGLTIHDVSDPSNIVLTGYFDSSPLSDGGFNGAWGAWPYLPSGNILVADIEEGLFVIGADYTRAALLEGTVTAFGSGNPLNAVQIEVSTVNLEEASNLFGEYATGTAVAGTYNVTFQKGGYLPLTVSNVELINGQTTTLDVELVPDVPFTVGGLITEEGTGTPIEGAMVQFSNEFFDLSYDSDTSGNYLDTTFFAGQYDVVVSAWGFVTECASFDVTESSSSLNFELESGYYDDFVTDLGWSVAGSASAGAWERGVPLGTSFEGMISNPNQDVGEDCGERAYVTGNGGGSAGNDDVDDGVTILRSPIMDLTTYLNPAISFQYWFFNDGGSGTPNDSYIVKINDGNSTTTLASLPETNSDWVEYSIQIKNMVLPTDQMQVIVEVDDSEPGHLVEGGLDRFRIVESTGILESRSDPTVRMYPNPATDVLNIHLSNRVKNCELRIYDAAGRVIGKNMLVGGLNSVNTPDRAGVYICEFQMDGQRQVERLLVN